MLSLLIWHEGEGEEGLNVSQPLKQLHEHFRIAGAAPLSPSDTGAGAQTLLWSFVFSDTEASSRNAPALETCTTVNVLAQLPTRTINQLMHAIHAASPTHMKNSLAPPSLHATFDLDFDQHTYVPTDASDFSVDIKTLGSLRLTQFHDVSMTTVCVGKRLYLSLFFLMKG